MAADPNEEPPSPAPEACPEPGQAAEGPVLSPVEGMRSFGLNSRAFYEAVCDPQAEPWIKAGSLQREPRTWGPRVERDTGAPSGRRRR